jgi:hypothetical protein
MGNVTIMPDVRCAQSAIIDIIQFRIVFIFGAVLSGNDHRR